MNAPVVKRQIRSKQFTQDIIDTIGKRLTEIRIPVPKDPVFAQRIAREIKEAIETRSAMRNKARALALAVQGIAPETKEQLEAVEEI